MPPPIMHSGFLKTNRPYNLSATIAWRHCNDLSLSDNIPHSPCCINSALCRQSTGPFPHCLQGVFQVRCIKTITFLRHLLLADQKPNHAPNDHIPAHCFLKMKCPALTLPGT